MNPTRRCYPIRVGVVCLGRHTFDTAAAKRIYEGIRADLSELEAVTFEFIEEMVVEVEDARAAGHSLASRDIDGLVCISGTFHLGHLLLELHKAIGKPIMLWAPTELPYDGGKIRLNSVCGLNLNASNLYKAGIRNYHANIGDQVDTDWLDALRVIRCLREARLGIAGHHAHGFFNLSVHEPSAYSELGVLIDHYELKELWELPVSDDDVARQRQRVEETFTCSGVTSEQVQQTARLTAQLHALFERDSLSGLAIRCWPEFAAGYGIAPCAAMSQAQADGLILACEGDVEGLLSMLAQSAVGGGAPFLFDFSQVDFKQDHALLWHCGVAPANLWDETSDRSLDSYHAGGKGVTADFVLKPGPISVLRLDSAGDEQRIYLRKGMGMPMEKQLKGSYLKARFEQPVRTVIEEIIENGLAHHASMVYGTHIRPFQILAKIKGWRVIGTESTTADRRVGE